jgi:6-pyruvoyltetrahydropterin/6-carboxytetrahydropterin synthase
MTHSLTVARDFVAQHFLIGGDWGDENRWHSHHYRLAVTLRGRTLDQHEYLVDIVDVEARLEGLVARYKDRTLNDLEEFSGRNPSIELFSRVLWQRFTDGLEAPNLDSVEITVWENEIAHASYRANLVGE